MEEDVRAHHGAHHRSHLKVDCAAVEDGIKPKPIANQAGERDEKAEAFFVADGAAPEKVIEKPAADEGKEADDCAHVTGEVGLGRVEKKGGAASVEEGDEKDEAADPSGVGLPLEDVQALRDLLGINDALLQEEDAAAVQHVHGAERFFAVLFVVAAQIEFEPGEEKGIADPHDGRHHVDHAEGDVEEFNHGENLGEPSGNEKTGT